MLVRVSIQNTETGRLAVQEKDVALDDLGRVLERDDLAAAMMQKCFLKINHTDIGD